MAHGALPFFVARRYLFSRKRISAINLVSAISVVGVAFGTAALLCTLSVFNGFHDLIGSLYTAFDPEVKIVAAKGKSFAADDPALEAVRRLPEVEAASASYTDNALILFRGNPQVITLKGVDDHFERVTGIRSILYPENGTYQLESAGLSYGIPGIGLASMMGSVDYGSIQICAPTRGERINLANPAASFNAEDLYSSGVCFAVSQKQYDEAYMIAPLAFAQRLFEHEGTLTSLELKLKPSADPEQALRRIRQTLGSGFKALNRAEQQEDTFNVMNIEKTMAYFFLTFILLVACFNIVGTVSMLMIDKRADVVTAQPRCGRRFDFPHFPLRGKHDFLPRCCRRHPARLADLLSPANLRTPQPRRLFGQLHHRRLSRQHPPLRRGHCLLHRLDCRLPRRALSCEISHPPLSLTRGGLF